ncbi:uncharacterized protein LOC122085716 [Macadamia integrifolia]|uniref:uncharacterized protein LOC122085716 n=1 Tax=Macadamia integrifolia TaxID=60698 RepID=UPI001C4E7758|nr:uncharacterized protein LOC122085716 [Macadamia integrifolia]
MELLKNLRRVSFLKSSIAFIFVVVSVSCLLVVAVSVLRLPEVSLGSNALGTYRALRLKEVSEEKTLGELGKMMVEMLPDDLAFTIFLPSEKAFERDVKLSAYSSLGEQNVNDTYAVLTRILGFSTVPRSLPLVAIPLGKEISLESIAGFGLYASRDSKGKLLVNRVSSERVDLRKGEIVVHIMHGVIMDAEFEQAFQPDYGGED